MVDGVAGIAQKWDDCELDGVASQLLEELRAEIVKFVDSLIAVKCSEEATVGVTESLYEKIQLDISLFVPKVGTPYEPTVISCINVIDHEVDCCYSIIALENEMVIVSRDAEQGGDAEVYRVGIVWIAEVVDNLASIGSWRLTLGVRPCIEDREKAA